jgi:hypothetical protein
MVSPQGGEGKAVRWRRPAAEKNDLSVNDEHILAEVVRADVASTRFAESIALSLGASPQCALI